MLSFIATEKRKYIFFNFARLINFAVEYYFSNTYVTLRIVVGDFGFSDFPSLKYFFRVCKRTLNGYDYLLNDW